MATALVSVEEYLNTNYEDGDREYVDGTIVETHVGDAFHAHVQLAFGSYLHTHYTGILWVGTAARVQVKPTRFRVPDVVAVLGSRPEHSIIASPPFIVVEVISPDDTVQELQQKVDDYLSFGIPHIWVLSPRSRRAWVYASEGSREVRDVLRTSEPVIEVPLAEIFA